MGLLRNYLEKILVWIKLWNIPLELFNPERIACIASAVGKPLYLDKAIEEWRRVSFARVCVETVNGVSPLKSIDVEVEDLGLISVRLEFRWGQRIYSLCKAPGHGENECKKYKKAWVHK